MSHIYSDWLIQTPYVGCLPVPYGSSIISYIEQFNFHRIRLAETNDWEHGKNAYDSIINLLRYSKRYSGQELHFLDDLPELQRSLLIGLDRLRLGLMIAKNNQEVNNDEYAKWGEKILGLKSKIESHQTNQS